MTFHIYSSVHSHVSNEILRAGSLFSHNNSPLVTLVFARSLVLIHMDQLTAIFCIDITPDSVEDSPQGAGKNFW
jgi:hypothetical protein